MKTLAILSTLLLGACTTTMKDGKEYYVIEVPLPTTSDPVIALGELAVAAVCLAQPERRGCAQKPIKGGPDL